MPWFRIDDGWHGHPKVLMAGNAAAGLWVRCGAYSAQHLTEGFVPVEIATAYGTRKEIERLSAVGLWSPVQGGYLIPDFLDYNPTAESVKAKRRSDAERQRRARESAAASRRDTQASNAIDRRPPDPDPTQPPVLHLLKTDLPADCDTSSVDGVLNILAQAIYRENPGKCTGTPATFVQGIRRNLVKERLLEIQLAASVHTDPIAAVAELCGSRTYALLAANDLGMNPTEETA